MTILAIDCGTKAGWALYPPPYRLFPSRLEIGSGFLPPQPQSGTLNYSKMNHGQRFMEFGDWLTLTLMETEASVVVFEAPLRAQEHAGSIASQLANGWRAIILMTCLRFRVPAFHITGSRVKSLALDRKRPPKGQAKSYMMKAGWNVGWMFHTDDECDAQWLATFAADIFARLTPQQIEWVLARHPHGEGRELRLEDFTGIAA